MMGLTDEERFAFDPASPWIEIDASLQAIVATVRSRGVADWVDDNGTMVLMPTTLGALALRVDAAARAAGVWP